MPVPDSNLVCPIWASGPGIRENPFSGDAHASRRAASLSYYLVYLVYSIHSLSYPQYTADFIPSSVTTVLSAKASAFPTPETTR